MDVKAIDSLATSAARSPEAGGPDGKPDRPQAPRPEKPVGDARQSSLNRKQLERIAKMIEQNAAKRASTRVGISLDEKTHEPVIQVTDRKSGRLIRQIPPREVQMLANKLERFQGVLVDRKA